MVHIQKLLPKSLNPEGQTFCSWGTFSANSGGDAARQHQRAAGSKQIDRAPIGRCARPQRRFGIWPRSKRDEPETGSTRVHPDTHNTIVWMPSSLLYLHPSSGRNGRTPNTTRADAEVAVETTGPSTRGRATLAPTSIPKCKGFCTPRRLTLGGMGAASRASVSAPSVPQGER